MPRSGATSTNFGTWAIASRFEGAGDFVGDRAVVLLDGRLHFLDRGGDLTGPVFDAVGSPTALPAPQAPPDGAGNPLEHYAPTAIGGAATEYPLLIHPAYGERWEICR